MLISDPNVIYLLLLVGLWATVFGIYTPGTGVGEVVAVVVLGVSILGLATHPDTNWLATGAVAGGTLMYLLLPLYRRGTARFALIGLAAQTVGGLFLINNAPVSPVLIVVTAVASFALYQFTLIPILNQRNAEPVLGDEELLPGSVGRVTTELNPTGTVNVRSEQWTAYSDEPIKVGESIVVIRKDGLKLYVERYKRKTGARRVGSDGEMEG